MVRDITRDVVRGLTVLEMETANNSGLDILEHAATEDWSMTWADTIFPTFSFLAGMSPIPPCKSLSLVGIGIFANVTNRFLSTGTFDLATTRYVGVLQRHGLASLVYSVAPSLKYFPAVATAVWTALTIALAKDPKNPFATPGATGQSTIDLAILPKAGLYGGDYDPEGLLGTLTTAVTMALGQAFAEADLDHKTSSLLGAGLLASGYVLSALVPKYFPMSKPFWTPSFVLSSAGFSILKYSSVQMLVPFLPEPVTYALQCLGRRSLEVYLVSGVVHSLMRRCSLWTRAKKALAEYVGVAFADLALGAVNNAAMAALAVYLVDNRLRLSY